MRIYVHAQIIKSKQYRSWYEEEEFIGVNYNGVEEENWVWSHIPDKLETLHL